MTTAGPAVEARGLTKRYRRGVRALDDVTLRVPPGSCTALVGPNAAGKSTLMKTLVGFERPTKGSVRVCGVDPWRRRGRALQHVGYVPQQPPLYRSLTVDQHLGMAARARRGFDRPAARAHLERIGIPMTAHPTKLSGGQQAQVMLAIALGTRADVLLLDEPLASLDPLARTEFLAIVRSVVRDIDTTVLLSSHIVSDIEEVCDRIVVLGAGRILLDDSIDHALTSHAIVRGAVQDPSTRVVGQFDDGFGLVHIVHVDQRSGVDGVRGSDRGPISLDYVVKGYLAAGKSLAEQDQRTAA
ncbi:MAG: ABC transporter ATP-binding protein [Chloroflexi bacterium]|nr:ABC transporter ATP-binding protein [Chloroflexota bacterium]